MSTSLSALTRIAQACLSFALVPSLVAPLPRARFLFRASQRWRLLLPLLICICNFTTARHAAALWCKEVAAHRKLQSNPLLKTATNYSFTAKQMHAYSIYIRTVLHIYIQADRQADIPSHTFDIYKLLSTLSAAFFLLQLQFQLRLNTVASLVLA